MPGWCPICSYSSSRPGDDRLLCPYCGGSVKVQCPDCVCTNCSGKGHTPCLGCGNGTSTCQECAGTGTVKRMFGRATCPTCDGTGMTYHKDCAGRGHVPCVACSGIGRGPNCATCGSTGHVPCQRCFGSGLYPSQALVQHASETLSKTIVRLPASPAPSAPALGRTGLKLDLDGTLQLITSFLAYHHWTCLPGEEFDHEIMVFQDYVHFQVARLADAEARSLAVEYSFLTIQRMDEQWFALDFAQDKKNWR